MDPTTREDTHNPVGDRLRHHRPGDDMLALAMLPLTIRRRRNRARRAISAAGRSQADLAPQAVRSNRRALQAARLNARPGEDRAHFLERGCKLLLRRRAS
jgi:hypothetical protein